jgi:hypothetical protein
MRRKIRWRLIGAEITSRLQESDQLLSLGGRQIPKAAFDMSCLTSMTPDRGFEREGREIVHESSFHPEAPQRDGEKLVSRVLRTSLNDAVAGSHIVQQEIAEGMNDLIAEGVRHHESAAVQHVPAGAVFIDSTWQMLQPMLSKSCWPAWASGVAASATSCAGTFVPRMNCVK